MVKALSYALAAIALSVGFFVFSQLFVQKQFKEFHYAVQTLYDKTESGEATREDAYAVKYLWAEKKKNLHIFLPHNDISYIDYWLGEACGLLYTQNYELALGKIEVLLEISDSLPNSYALSFENVF